MKTEEATVSPFTQEPRHDASAKPYPRWNQRNQFYAGDMPHVHVHFINQGTTVSAQVIDLSSSGIGLCHQSFDKTHTGQEVEIRYTKTSRPLAKGVVRSFNSAHFSGQQQNRIGVEFIIQTGSPHYKRPVRFPTNPLFRPVAHGQHPFRFQHRLFFTAMDFSAAGVSLLGNDTNNLLIPGIRISLTFLIPTQKEFEQEVEIVNLRPHNKYELKESNNHFILGCQFVNPSKDFLSAISSYLLLDHNVRPSIKDLLANGFIVDEIKPAITISYASDKTDWDELLSLRLRSAQHAGRWLGETNPQKMCDNYDQYARHVLCRIHGNLVGASRIVFNNGEAERTEHNGVAEIPEKLWKSGFVECSRACTDPRYRGASVFFVYMVQQTGVITAQTGYHYSLLNCEDSLVPVYKRCGGKPLGQRFYTPYMQETALNLILFDTEKIFYGIGINPIYWYLMWKDVQQDLERRGVIQPSLYQKFRRFISHIIGAPLAHSFLAKKARGLLSLRDQRLQDFRRQNKVDHELAA